MKKTLKSPLDSKEIKPVNPLCSTGVADIYQGIALVLGENIGTTITSWQIEGGKVVQMQTVTAATKLTEACSLEEKL